MRHGSPFLGLLLVFAGILHPHILPGADSLPGPIVPGETPPTPHGQAEDLAKRIAAWEADLASTLAITHRDIRGRLESARRQAHDRHQLARELLLTLRLRQLPPDPVEIAKEDPGNPGMAIPAIDLEIQAAQRAAEERLAEHAQSLADDLDSALAEATRRGAVPEVRRLWQRLAGLPHPWTEVPGNPIPGRPDYDRKQVLPIPRLPAYLELTVEPGGHDLHIGVGGRDDEEVTEIYLGGWFGHGSGIRTSPGGEEVVSRNEFPYFTPSRPTVITDPERLLDDRSFSPFSRSQPTVFRLAVGNAGLVLSRLEQGRVVPFMTTDRLFNHPTCFILRSATFRLLSLRIHPATTWTDQSRVRHPSKPERVNF